MSTILLPQNGKKNTQSHTKFTSVNNLAYILKPLPAYISAAW